MPNKLPGAVSREQLLHLLAEAAEFEHNLLCCYLYAAFSIRGEGDPTLSDDERSIVGGWRKSIMSVAMEEMCHLALVANLTVAIGGRPHFNRPNLPIAPGYHPAGIVIELAPFDMETLEHFIFLERPADAPVADSASFDDDAGYRRGERAGSQLMPSACDYETIAEFYEHIRSTLCALSAKNGEGNLFTGAPEAQLGPDLIRLEGLSAITSLASAVTAIDQIVLQGEGSTSDNIDSHFARFNAIKAAYESMLATQPEFQPAHPAARNPVMRQPVDELLERVHVKDAYAAAVLDVANALYNQMLRMLTQAYGCNDAAWRKKLVAAAIELMTTMSEAGSYLATLPAREDTPGVNAGITFAMLRATEPWLEDKHQWARFGERFAELAEGMSALSGRGYDFAKGIARMRKQAQVFGAGPGAGPGAGIRNMVSDTGAMNDDK